LPPAPRTPDDVPSGVAPPRAPAEFETMQAKKEKGVVIPQSSDVEMKSEELAASSSSAAGVADVGPEEAMAATETMGTAEVGDAVPAEAVATGKRVGFAAGDPAKKLREAREAEEEGLKARKAKFNSLMPDVTLAFEDSLRRNPNNIWKLPALLLGIARLEAKRVALGLDASDELRQKIKRETKQLVVPGVRSAQVWNRDLLPTLLTLRE